MDLSNIIHALKSHTVRHDREYQAARAACPVLAPFATARALLEAAPALDEEARYAVVSALVAAYQRSGGHVLWSSMLLHLFAPLLLRIVTQTAGTPDDRFQRAALAFLEILRAIPGGIEKPAGYLRVAVERWAWKTNARQRAGLSRARRLPPAHPEDRLIASVDVGRALRGVPAPLLDAVRATVCGGEPLVDYVARVHAAPDAISQNRTYRCLQKQRERLFLDLKIALGEDAAPNRPLEAVA